MPIIEAIVAKLVSLLIDYLWKHHEGRMTEAAKRKLDSKVERAQEEATNATQKADRQLETGAVVAADVAAGSLRAGSEAINRELGQTD